jgi:hypothetical protein
VTATEISTNHNSSVCLPHILPPASSHTSAPTPPHCWFLCSLRMWQPPTYPSASRIWGRASSLPPHADYYSFRKYDSHQTDCLVLLAVDVSLPIASVLQCYLTEGVKHRRFLWSETMW